MGLDCGAKCAKLILFVFNVIFFLCGVALLGLGIWVTVDKNSLTSLVSKSSSEEAKVAGNYLSTESLIYAAGYVLIAVGAFVFLIGFCGCCGAVKESQCLLYTYSVLLVVILLIQVVAVILGAVFKAKIEAALHKVLAKSLNSSYVGLPKSKEKGNALSLAWDYAMIDVKCCGLYGPTDFETKNNVTKWYEEGRMYFDGTTNHTGNDVKLPMACCELKNDDFVKKAEWGKFPSSMKNTQCPLTGKDRYEVGCYKAAKDKVSTYAVYIISAGAAIAVIELFGVIIACCLISAIKNEY